MRSNFKILHKIFCVICAAILLSCICAVSVCAEEISEEVQAVIALIEKLPIDTETVTIANKADIIAAKEAYNALDAEQRMQLSSDHLVRLNGNHSALMPFVLGELVAQLKTLPEKIQDSDKEKIISIYSDFKLLDESTKSAINDEHKEKLLSAVYNLAPDELSEADSETISAIEEEKKAAAEKEKQLKAEKKAKRKAILTKVLHYSIIAVVIIMVLCMMSAMIIMIIKIVKLPR